MDLQATALGGLLALGGAIVGALATLLVERRRTAGQLRVALFERRYTGYAEVLRPLSDLHDWLVQVCGNLGPKLLTGSELAQFAKDAALRCNLVTSAVQANSLAMDRRGMDGILQYLGRVVAVAEDGQPLPTLEDLGDRFGKAINACHEALSIPGLARETYREVERLGRRRP